MLKRLADKHPDAVAQLTLQYRMHSEICNLPNLLVYKGNLKCANDEVRKKKLILPQFPRYLRRIINPGNTGLGWLVPVLNPNKPVAFASTDMISQSSSKGFEGLEVSRGRGNDRGGLVNDIEVSLTKFVVQGLQGCGLDLANIGIISPYRAQVGEEICTLLIKILISLSRLFLNSFYSAYLSGRPSRRRSVPSFLFNFST